MSRTGISYKHMMSHRYPCPRAPPAFRDERCMETVPHADCRVCLSLSPSVSLAHILYAHKTETYDRKSQVNVLLIYNYLAFLYIIITTCMQAQMLNKITFKCLLLTWICYLGNILKIHNIFLIIFNSDLLTIKK